MHFDSGSNVNVSPGSTVVFDITSVGFCDTRIAGNFAKKSPDIISAYEQAV